MFDNSGDKRSTDSSKTDGSRRRFLAGSAGALGTLALGSAFGTGSVLADDDHDEDDGSTPPGEPMEEMFEDDVAVLNYALTLEYLEAAFYRRGLDNIGQDEMMHSDHLEKLPESVKGRIYSELEVIREHEEIHVETLSAVITDLGGEPVDEPEFDFGSAVEDPAEFIDTAAILEDTGVAAYAGAAPSIENADLVPPALSIHSVEARHASFVRELGGQIGFPDAFDEPLPKDAVLEAAGQFIVSDMAVDDDTETKTEDHDDDTETESDDH